MNKNKQNDVESNTEATAVDETTSEQVESVEENSKTDQLNQVDESNFDDDTSSETRDLNEFLRVEEQKDIDPKKAIVSFKKVALEFDQERVLSEVDLDIYEGEFVYFVGQSGAGKSSLAKMVYREIKPTDGEIYVDGEEIGQMKNNKMPYLRRKIGVIFQDYKLLKDKTVYENVRYSLDVTGYEKAKREEQVLKTLERVGILDQKDKYPDELSGGQQQRVAIARAIVDDPKIIVADEPTGNLDPENALQIMEILMNINSTGTTFIMATHDVGIVNIFKNRVVLLKDGQVANETEGEYIYE